MKNALRIILAAAVLLILTGAAAAQTSTNYGIPWDVASSGGEQMAAGSLTMQATAGQVAVDVATSTNYRLEAGFWTSAEGTRSDTLLPLVLRMLGLR